MQDNLKETTTLKNFLKEKLHQDKVIESLDIQGEELENVKFEKCIFIKCKLQNTSFKNCIFEDVKIKNSNITLAKFENCCFRNVEIIDDTKATGIVWSNIKKTTSINFNIIFKDSKIDTCTFDEMDLRKLKIKNCSAQNMLFTTCDLEEADFEYSDLQETIFQNCNLKRANFVNAKNYHIDIFFNKLHSAKFSLPEAVNLLENLDIILV